MPRPETACKTIDAVEQAGRVELHRDPSVSCSQLRFGIAHALLTSQRKAWNLWRRFSAVTREICDQYNDDSMTDTSE